MTTAWLYGVDGGIAEMEDSLYIQLSAYTEKRFDKKLNETEMAMTEEQRQAKTKLRKLEVTASLSTSKKERKAAEEVCFKSF